MRTSGENKILETWSDEFAFYIKYENGLLRLRPCTETAIRVSFACKDESVIDLGDHFTFEHSSYKYEGIPFVDWFGIENDSFVTVKTPLAKLVLDKKAGTISYCNDEGDILCIEGKDSERELEKLPDSDKFRTKIYLTFDDTEGVYGFGQSDDGSWNLRNSTYYVYQANRRIAIPMMVSDKGYGVLMGTESLCTFSDGADGAYVQTEASNYLDYYFVGGGDMFSIIRDFRLITGKAAMLPKWAYGYVQSKERYVSQEELLEVSEEFSRRNIPLDLIVLDWLSWDDGMWGQKSFDKSRFPDPKGMVDKLHDNGAHFMMSIWPNMDPKTENNREFKEEQLLLPDSDIYDAFSKEARKLYFKQVREGLLDCGVDAFWCDSSEPISPEWDRDAEPSQADAYADYMEKAGKLMPDFRGNSYGLYHARGMYEGLREERPGSRVVNLTRSGWAGSQKYGTVLWSGDISASWDCLDKQVRCGLSFTLSGMPYWTLDAGGFFVKNKEQWYWSGEYEDGMADESYKELYVRWLQFALFLPMFRSHGSDIAREPWRLGDEGDKYYDAVVATIKKRYELMPYIYSEAAKVNLEDGLLMRPLMFDFAGDERAKKISDQYMFGSSLMVCPVTAPVYSRKVYLPKGCDWYDFYTDKLYKGGQEIEAKAPLWHIPVFVKVGSIVPLSTCCDKSVMALENCEYGIKLTVYPGKDATYSLYEDAGDGYDYENGDYCITDIFWDDAEKKLSYETSGNDEYRKGELSFQCILG